MPDPLVSFLSLRGERRTGPAEWEPMLVTLNIPQIGWEKASLSVGRLDLPLSLRRINGRMIVVAEWPRSGPGYYEIIFASPAGSGRLTVTVSSSKLDEGELGRMLEELEHELPTDVAIGLQRLGGLAGIRLRISRRSSVAEEAQRIRDAIEGTARAPGLLTLLAAISREPYVRLKATTEWVRRDLARRPSPRGLVLALQRQRNLSEDGLPEQLIDSRVIHTADVYENRMIQSFVRQVQQRARRLVPILSHLGKAELAAEVAALANRLARSHRAAAFLDDVQELASPPNRITMVLLKRPPYRAALSAYLAFQRSLSVRLETPALDAPLKELPFLYQLWVTMYVIGELLKAGEECGFVLQSQSLISQDERGLAIRPLRNGRTALVLRHHGNGSTVSLIPERTYPRSQSCARRPYSLSYEQRPDVAIEISGSKGISEVLIFDPKYKVNDIASSDGGDSRPLKTDIDKMHTYRDAIRDSQGRHVVGAAAIIYPGPTLHFEGGIAAIGAQPHNAESLRSEINEMITSALARASSGGFETGAIRQASI